jgi:glycosyltransferase involved in cell wall biosynthesis
MSVSIIIPVFNAEAYLASTLNSCLNQDMTVVKEIILVNDHSTDSSRDIIKEYQSNHPNLIKFLSNEGRKGAPASRNLGIKHATGDYIQFLDADDLLSKDKLKCQYDALVNSKGQAVATCSWFKFQDDLADAEVRKQHIDKSYENPWEWLVDSWSGMGVGQTGIWLVSKDLIDQVSGFDESLEMNQDGDFFAKVLLRADQIIYCDSVSVYYRNRYANSVSKNTTDKAAWSVLQSYKAYEDILNFIDLPKIREALCSNYYRFVYQYYNKYQELAEEAMNRAESLGFEPFERDNLSWFSVLSKSIGYRNTFKLRQLIKGY